MIGATTRSVFFVFVAAGAEPTALNNNLPLNQTLADVLDMVLALKQQFDPGSEPPPSTEFQLFDLHKQPLDKRILVQQIPFPGGVIAVSDQVQVRRGEGALAGEAAVHAVVDWVAMRLFAQREDPEDAVMRRYLRFLASG